MLTLLDLVTGRLAADPQSNLDDTLAERTAAAQERVRELVHRASGLLCTCEGCRRTSSVAEASEDPCGCREGLSVEGVAGHFSSASGVWRWATETTEGAQAATPDPLGSWARPTGAGERSGLHEFEVRALLGRGAFGSVYEAVHLASGTPVALKVLSSDRDRERQMRRFTREGEALARLRHPNIVRVFEVGTYRDRPYLALELVSGSSLAAAIGPTGYRSIPEAAAVARDLAAALQHAHEHGVVHRDVKPANVLLDAAGRPRLADFGLVTDLGLDWSRLTLTGGIVGTPAYMAPEQLSGPAEESSAPALDVYGLGALLYELLTGAPPFHGVPGAELFVHILEKQPPAPSGRNPAVPPQLDAIVARALAKKPADRYASAGAFRDDLDSFLDGAGEPRGRRAVVGGAIAAVAIVTAALGSSYLAPEAAPEAGGSPPQPPASPTVGSGPRRTSPPPQRTATRRLELLCDFDARGSEGWDAWPAAVSSASIGLPPRSAGSLPAGPAPSGRALRLQTRAAGQGVVWSAPPADWRDAAQLRFWVYRSEPAPLELDLRLTGERGHLWRKVTVETRGWSRVSIPIRWFRRAAGAYPQLGRIRELSFGIRSAGEVWIDALHRTLAPGAGRRSVDDIKRALPASTVRASRTFSSGADSLLTSNPQLGGAALLRQLRRAEAELTALTPGLEPWSAQGTTLIVLRDRAELRRTVGALAKAFGGTPPKRISQSFVFEQLISSTAPDHTVRPVFLRHWAQSRLEALLGMAHYGWLSSGIGQLVRIRAGGVSRERVIDWVRRKQGEALRMRPLCRLWSVREPQQWQAMTLVESLAESPRLRARWPTLLKAIRAAGSVDLEPHLGPVLGIDWDVLEGVWRAHCRDRYGLFERK